MATSIGDLAVILSADTGQAEKKLHAFGGNVDRLDRKVKNFGDTPPRMKGIDAADRRLSDRMRSGGGFGVLGMAAEALPAAAAVAALGTAALATKRSLDLAGEAEKNRLAFEAMTGSALNAGRVLSGLRNYAAESPFNTAQITDIGKRLLAFGIEADQITPTVRALGDIAAATGGDLGRLALAFGQVRTTGRLMGDELNQFAEQGVPLADEIAKVLGRPREEIKQLVSDGQVGFDVVAKAIDRMTAGGGRFAGLADRYANSFAGLSDRAADTAESIGRDLGAALIQDLRLSDVLKDGLRYMEALRPAIEDVRPGLRAVGDGLRVAVRLSTDMGISAMKTAKLVAAFGGAFFGPEMKAGLFAFGQLRGLLKDFEGMDLQQMLHRGLAFGLDQIEFGLLIVADGIDAVIGGAEKLKQVWDQMGIGAKAAFAGIGEAIKAVALPVDVLIAKMGTLGKALADPKQWATLAVDIDASAKEMATKWGGVFATTKPAVNPKGDFNMAAVPPGRLNPFTGEVVPMRPPDPTARDPQTARERVQAGFDAVRRANADMEMLHNAGKYTLRNFNDNLRAGLSAENVARLDKFATGVLDASGSLRVLYDVTQTGRKALGLAGDPLRATAAAARSMEVKAAPSAQYGTQAFAQLVQQAVMGQGPKDQLAVAKEQLRVQERIAANGDALLNRIQPPPPKVVKLGGE